MKTKTIFQIGIVLAVIAVSVFVVVYSPNKLESNNKAYEYLSTLNIGDTLYRRIDTGVGTLIEENVVLRNKPKDKVIQLHRKPLDSPDINYIPIGSEFTDPYNQWMSYKDLYNQLVKE
jgi:hypothetical protein